MAQAAPTRPVTPAEYLAAERDSQQKHLVAPGGIEEPTPHPPAAS